MVEGLVLEGSVWGGVASGCNMIFCEVGLLERTGGISMLVSERVGEKASVTFVGGRGLMGQLSGLVTVSSGITVLDAVVGILAVGFIDGLKSKTSSISVFSLFPLLLKNFSLNPEDRPSLLSIVKPEGTVSVVFSLFSGLTLLLKNFSLKPEGISVCGGEG